MMRRLLAAVFLVLAGAWLLPAPAHACSCVTDSEPEQIKNAEVIFAGTLTGGRSLGGTRTYTVAVDRVYRGQVMSTQALKTPDQSPACGLELPEGGPYLVLGYLEDGVLWANSCGGTRTGAPPADLGAGYPPQPGSSENPVVWVVLGGVVLVLAATIVVPAVVRRRSAGPR